MTEMQMEKGKRSRRPVFWWIVALGFLWLVWDMPLGYFRFMRICHSESGVHVSRQLIPAKAVRLDADEWPEAFSRGLLTRFPALRAVEGRDEKYSTARPSAYARYERAGSDSAPGAATGTSRSLDQVERRRGVPVTVKSGPSEADYFLSLTEEERWPRIHLRRTVMRDSGGNTAAVATSVVYSWTDPQHTLLGRAPTEYCGETAATAGTHLDKLIELVAHRR